MGKSRFKQNYIEKLKGVGRKTANIVITMGYNKPGVAVDTHVHRISNRLGLVETKTPYQKQNPLDAGIEPSEKDRSGSFLQQDCFMVFSTVKYPGLELMSTTESLKEQDWLKDSIPEFKAMLKDLDLSHEAAIGKIAEEEIQYLMARCLSEDEATLMIIRGFLNVDITGLPDALARETKKMFDMSLEKVM